MGIYSRKQPPSKWIKIRIRLQQNDSTQKPMVKLNAYTIQSIPSQRRGIWTKHWSATQPLAKKARYMTSSAGSTCNNASAHSSYRMRILRKVWEPSHNDVTWIRVYMLMMILPQRMPETGWKDVGCSIYRCLFLISRKLKSFSNPMNWLG